MAAAIVAASTTNAVLALLARAANVPDDFQPLTPRSYIFLTAVGVILGAVGWALVRRASKKPGHLLRWLVPIVVGASFVPDFLLFEDGGAVGVAALLLMHVAVASIGVVAYRIVMPLPAR
ncbi:DUF6069 family protein [Saccharopolyspora sp. NPDC049426]|uniref:DUF6069 family protein n=1 Tax=Saccharopolyspora sp. NPDC049426 TaxID=3155652 RepID=UPI0034211DD0